MATKIILSDWSDSIMAVVLSVYKHVGLGDDVLFGLCSHNGGACCWEVHDVRMTCDGRRRLPSSRRLPQAFPLIFWAAGRKPSACHPLDVGDEAGNRTVNMVSIGDDGVFASLRIFTAISCKVSEKVRKSWWMSFFLFSNVRIIIYFGLWNRNVSYKNKQYVPYFHRN